MDVEFETINNFIKKKNIISVLDLLVTKDKFNKYSKLLLSNFEDISDNDMILYIKILLNRILFFEGNVDTSTTENLYKKLEDSENIHINVINKFITLYDEFKKIKLLLFSLTYHFITKFRRLDSKFSYYLKKGKLGKSDITYIYNKVNTDIYSYFLSFFDANNNSMFMKKIHFYSRPGSQSIVGAELLLRIEKLVKIFRLKFLNKLKIKIITREDFIEFPYNKKLQYFESFFIKINSLFKLYTKYYNLLEELEYKLNELVKIDIFDFCLEITDSSSFVLSEENYPYLGSEYGNKNEVFDENESDSSVSSLFVTEGDRSANDTESELVDTPFVEKDLDNQIEKGPDPISDENNTIMNDEDQDVPIAEHQDNKEIIDNSKNQENVSSPSDS